MNEENKLVKISYNPDEEMMHIENDRGTVFYGNYWDFKREPEEIKKFLVQLGLPVKLDKDLRS